MRSPHREPLLFTAKKALHDWREEIVRMWRFTRNNGITEGFCNFENYRLRVIAQCG